MTKIQVYSDETKANNNSFLIYAMIYGAPDKMEEFNDELKTIIHPKESKDKDFKGLHSHNLNESNWHTIGIKFESVLDALKKHILQGNINAKVCIIAAEKNKNNTGYLKDLIKKELLKDGSKIKEMFSSLSINDHPALYHRLDQLFLYFIYRDRLGPSGTYFELYPDSSGKILSYKEKEFNVTGSHNISADLKFYELVKVLGNTIAKVFSKLKFPGWSHSDQEIEKIEPLKWSDSCIIQLCDILANFFYCYLRYNVGLTDKKYKLKSDALSTRFGFNDFLSKVKANFELRDGEVFCNDNSTLLTIDFNKS
jgi:hypothetical protein